MRAFAKINLILDILSKRPDGYHNLYSVMQTLKLHDIITITKKPAEAGTDNFLLTCSDPNLPTDDRNLVTRAAKYILKKYNINQAINIHLEKYIPQSAGLAGGSSDCAATITGLNALLNLGIPLYSNEKCSLMSIGQQFGADVSFCLTGGTAIAEGIGEILTPLPPHPHCWVVLACPNIPVSTADIFGQYKPITKQNKNHKKIIDAITQGDLQGIAANFSNDLTQVTTKLHPTISKLITTMIAQGALNAAMSGSGPSVFGYFDDKDAAQKAHNVMEKQAGRAFLTEIYP
ncbi:MAG: 4-(cytidine 5'-diphospho)-2-C-methyl-D-erythritol kinase [Defluviitaleaceae bacterium]|nr:4-(cytidine 5'-diphospho)-2-C-methyl-D-erythritol kinase [Defluviitaleaceae bacterium]